MVEQGTQTLLDKIPEWKSPDVAKKEQQAIKDFAMNELELTAEEVEGIIDPRIVIGLRKAWQYGNTEKAVKRKPKEKAKARVGRPGTSNVKRTTSPAKKARQKLAKSGKIQDAAKVFGMKRKELFGKKAPQTPTTIAIESIRQEIRGYLDKLDVKNVADHLAQNYDLEIHSVIKFKEKKSDK